MHLPVPVPLPWPQKPRASSKEVGARVGWDAVENGLAKALGQAWAGEASKCWVAGSSKAKPLWKHLIWEAEAPVAKSPTAQDTSVVETSPVRVATGRRCPESMPLTYTLHRVWDG